MLSKSFTDFLRNQQFKSRVANIIFTADANESVMRRNYTNILTTDQVNYLTLRQDGKISYLPAGKEHLTNEKGTWQRKNRQDGSAAKVIRKLFTAQAIKKLKLKDSDFEIFSNIYKSANSLDPSFKFELLPASSIPEVYGMKIGNPYGSGSLQGSCMRNAHPDTFAIYANCKQLEILTLTKTDETGEVRLHGRCLVWSLKDGDKDIKLCDRFYVSADHLYETFKSYAEDHGYWYKSNFRTYDYKTMFVNPEGETVERFFKVETPTTFSEYPYIDTFTYGGEGYLTNKYLPYGNNQFKYCCTDGERRGDPEKDDDHEDEVWCEYTDRYISCDEAVYIDNGSHRYRDQYFHIDDCVEVNGRWYFEEDDAYICKDYYGDWQLCDECVEVEGDMYRYDDDAICTTHDDEICLIADCVQLDDDWYRKDDDKVCEDHNGEYQLKEDCQEIDGNFYLTDECTEIDGEFHPIDICIEIEGDYYLPESQAIYLDPETETYKLKQLKLDLC